MTDCSIFIPNKHYTSNDPTVFCLHYLMMKFQRKSQSSDLPVDRYSGKFVVKFLLIRYNSRKNILFIYLVIITELVKFNECVLHIRICVPTYVTHKKAVVIFQFSDICLYFSSVCLQFFKMY